MSTNLNGAVSAQINKCTNQQNNEVDTADFIGMLTADCSPFGSVIQSLATNDIDDPVKVLESLTVANSQIISLLKVVAQCARYESEYQMYEGIDCDKNDSLNALNLVSQLLQISNDAQDKIHRVLAEGRHE